MLLLQGVNNKTHKKYVQDMTKILTLKTYYVASER